MDLPGVFKMSSPTAEQELFINHDSEGSLHSATHSPISPNFSLKYPSIFSEESKTTMDTSVKSAVSSAPLPALQEVSIEYEEELKPLDQEDLDDPASYDLISPTAEDSGKAYSLEARSEQLFSTEHLKIIFSDPTLLVRFIGFLKSNRPQSVPILVYYLDAIKALKAIAYSNAIAEALEPMDGFEFSKNVVNPTTNETLQRKADQAFGVLVREDLPAYITYVYTQTVSASISQRVCGRLPAHLREASEGLAEVFCLTDPSRPDNPIVFASEEFHRTTQYGMNYVLGRNCRFLQGPKTNPNSVRRIRDSVLAGRDHCEVFLNYRRDGSPFMNLLMTSALCDSRGKVRYCIGAQVDVSGLVKECSELESLERLVAQENSELSDVENEDQGNQTKKDELQELSEMLNEQELDTIERYGGRMHREHPIKTTEPHSRAIPSNKKQTRLLISEGSPEGLNDFNNGSYRINRGKLSGVYENYLLVRPYPSLRILFASPSLRVPGILQSAFLSKIGGSSRIREELTRAFANCRGVTAKIRWVSKNDEEGRNRWIHCTPLLGSNGAVGVWMVVIVDDEGPRRPRQAAPIVDPRFGRSIPTGDYDNVNLRDYAVIRSQGMMQRVSRPSSSNRSRSRSRAQSSRSEYLGNLHRDDSKDSLYSLRV